MFATMSGGALFRSGDGGAHWHFSGAGLSAPYAASVTFASQSTIYAATSRSGVFRSTDYGSSWHQLGFTGRMTSVAVDPFTPSTLLIGTDVTGSPDSVYKSVDSGVTWALSDSGMDTYDYGQVFADPSTPGLFYAATFLHVFRSTNWGASWAERDTGITQVQPGLGTFTMDPTDRNRLYVPSVFEFVVYASNNAGATWTKSAQGLPTTSYPQQLAVDPSANQRLYLVANGLNGVGGKLRLSTDYGASWSTLDASPDDPSTVTVAPDGTVYASNANGIFVSHDQGQSWQASNSGLSAMSMYGISAAPGGQTLFATGQSGTWKSTDTGSTWTLVDTQAGFKVLVDPANPQMVLVRLSSSNLRRSADGGATWSAVSLSCCINDIAFPTSGGPTVFAAGSSGMFVSSDDGASFVPRNNGLSSGQPPFGGGSPPQMYGVAMQSDNPTHVVAVSNQAAYLSTNGGSSWSKIGGLPTQIYRAAASDPQVPGTLYVASDSNLYGSTNGGASWSHIGSLPSLSNSFTSFVSISPLADHTFYVGTPTGLASSLDSGATWTMLTAGLVSTDVRAMAFANGRTYLATAGGGVVSSATGGR
jgi:hypothetical protein